MKFKFNYDKKVIVPGDQDGYGAVVYGGKNREYDLPPALVKELTEEGVGSEVKEVVGERGPEVVLPQTRKKKVVKPQETK